MMHRTHRGLEKPAPPKAFVYCVTADFFSGFKVSSEILEPCFFDCLSLSLTFSLLIDIARFCSYTLDMSTELQTLQTELTSVRAAMTAITQGGQQVTIGNLTYTEANYNALAARERDLSARVSRLSNSRPRVLPVNFAGFMR